MMISKRATRAGGGWAARGGVRTLIVVLAAWTLTLFAGPVRAERARSLSQTLTGAAKADFEAAKVLAADGDFAGALIKFQSAYDAAKDPRILWNVAYCDKNLRHYAKVTAILKRYLAEGGALLSAGDRKDAQELIDAIEPFTTRVTFRVSQPDAQIFVDDEPVGSSPLGAPVVLDLGERRVRVTKDGYLPFEKSFVVAGGPELKIDVGLVPEVHQGTLVIEAPTGAAVFIDDKQVGAGRVEKTIASGGHQLRITAPGMRPFQSEVVIKDRETRSVNVLLEAETQAEKRLPALRLAVGCADPEPKGPEDGLTVSADGLGSLRASNIERKWNDEAGRSVIERTEYPITPGRHKLRIGINDCQPSDLDVDVDPIGGASVAGALESGGSLLLRGPLGTPGSWRAGFGLWTGAGHAGKGLPEVYHSDHGPSIAGAVLTLGLVSRWLELFLDSTYGSGTFAREHNNSSAAVPDTAHATWMRLLLRGGPRLPLGRASFGLGPLIGMERVALDKSLYVDGSGRGLDFMLGSYVEVDVQPLCEWGLFTNVEFAWNRSDTGSNSSTPDASLQFGAFYAPNASCRRERGAVGLLQSDAPGASASALGEPGSRRFRESAGRAWRNDGIVMMITGGVLVGFGVLDGLFAHSFAQQVSTQYDPSRADTGRLLGTEGVIFDITGAVAVVAGATMVVHGWLLRPAPPAAKLDLHVADADRPEVAR